MLMDCDGGISDGRESAGDQAACVITPFEELRPGIVLVQGGKVLMVGRLDHVAIPHDAQVLMGERILVRFRGSAYPRCCWAFQRRLEAVLGNSAI